MESSNNDRIVRLELVLSGDASETKPLITSLVEFARPAKEAVPRAQPPHELSALACRMYDSRRKRGRFIPSSLFGEPAWDMLLALYCFASRGEVLSVSGLCHAADVPHTTALRWAHTMEAGKLIVRLKDASDGRRFHVALSEAGTRLMDEYLAYVNDEISAGNPT